ncbi:hypothetical protein V502_01043 [Pseudogymnoascus sp. VKM F-4520 (FW-2644)]|nr:hypothetical protein V502_01043 [Pseudogymnoascus sp. VKM F-4520 (FW-2644)]
MVIFLPTGWSGLQLLRLIQSPLTRLLLERASSGSIAVSYCSPERNDPQTQASLQIMLEHRPGDNPSFATLLGALLAKPVAIGAN